jgi:hypothetical protein
MGAVAASTLIKRDTWLPLSVEQVLRKALVDRFNGNMQLNIQDGVIRSEFARMR